jgi:4'-phosphopantetheinyl transferase
MKKRENVEEFKCSWNNPSANLNLLGDEIHVWRAHLDPTQGQIQRLEKFLSPDEQLKANRFYFERHRKRYIVVHGILRMILGRYLGLEPSQLVFSHGLHGKPALVPVGAGTRLQFNLSHSHELALYGVSRNFLIGIDLERINNRIDREALAKRFFSPCEYAAIRSLPGDQKEQAFFKIWTIKEAYLKATGQGLGKLKEVEVCLTRGQPTALVSTQGPYQQANHGWSAHLLTPAQGYAGCIVIDAYDLNAGHFCGFEAAALSKND